jgi:hypothetical protein
MQLRALLEPHLDTEIGVNIAKALHIDGVKLIAVHDEFFTVHFEHDGNTYHVPYLNVVKILENPEGVSVGGLFKHRKAFPIVVRIGHMVDYIPA